MDLSSDDVDDFLCATVAQSRISKFDARVAGSLNGQAEHLNVAADLYA